MLTFFKNIYFFHEALDVAQKPKYAGFVLLTLHLLWDWVQSSAHSAHGGKESMGDFQLNSLLVNTKKYVLQKNCQVLLSSYLAVLGKLLFPKICLLPIWRINFVQSS